MELDLESDSWPWSLRNFDNLDEEIDFYRETLEQYKEDGVKESGVLRAQLLLGTAYASAGRFADAELMLCIVLSRMGDIWGWNHVAAVACVKTLTRVLESLEKNDEAHELYQAAINNVRREMGREYPWTLDLSTSWACFCARRSYFDQARYLFTESYQSRRHIFGRNHRAAIDTLRNLARLILHQSGEGYEHCESLMLAAVEESRKLYGDGHDNTRRAVNHLVSIHVRAGNCNKARELCDEFEVEGEHCCHYPTQPANVLAHVVPVENNLCEWHNNDLIPPLKMKPPSRSTGELPVERMKDIIRKIGPKWGKRGFGSLEWARGWISEWVGMDIKTFTEHLGIDDSMGWSNFNTPSVILEEACSAGHEPAVRMLLETYSKANNGSDEMKLDMQACFRKAVTSGSETVVRLFTDLEIDVNTPDGATRTALHDAAEMGHEHIAKTLLEIGADQRVVDENGNIPMDLAMKAGHEAVVRLFMVLNGAILTNSTSAAKPKSSAKQKRQRIPWVSGLNSTVVHFYVEHSFSDAGSDESGPNDAYRVQNVPVERLVWDQEGQLKEILANEAGSELYPKADFRWIHLPANCVGSIEYLERRGSER